MQQHANAVPRRGTVLSSGTGVIYDDDWFHADDQRARERRRDAAGDWGTPEHVLNRLADDVSREVRLHVAGNPATSAETLRYMSSRNDGGCINGIASNPATPMDVLSALADEERGFDLCWRVATNRSTSADILERLSHVKFEGVRVRVALNENTSTETLDRLADDPYDAVQRAVADNSHTSVDALTKLVEREAATRVFVASNPNTPYEIRRLLVDDEDIDVRCALALHVQDDELLNLLAQDPVYRVRRIVALSDYAPISALEALASDEAEFVRGEVAGNERTPSEVLDLLASDHSEMVRRAVFINVNY